MPAFTECARGWPWGPAVVAVAAVPVAAVPVGSVCTITTHRRCLATQSIRRLGRSARRTNTNLTALRASQCSTGRDRPRPPTNLRARRTVHAGCRYRLIKRIGERAGFDFLVHAHMLRHG